MNVFKLIHNKMTNFMCRHYDIRNFAKSSLQLSTAILLSMTMLYTSSVNAASYNVQILDLGGEQTQFAGINQLGEIVGVTFEENGSADGIIYDMNSGELTYPGQGFFPVGINNSGLMGGLFVDSSGFQTCGTLDKDGVITELFPPAKVADPNAQCQARAVNENGKVTGYTISQDVITGQDVYLGFLIDTHNGKAQEFLPSSYAVAQGINAQKQHVGSVQLEANEAYPDSLAGTYAFMRNKKGHNRFFEIAGPQWQPLTSEARGISENGLIVGFTREIYFGGLASFRSGWIFDSSLLSSSLSIEPEMLPHPVCNLAGEYKNQSGGQYEGYYAFTEVFPQGVDNQGVVVGSCWDVYANPVTFELTFDDFHGYIATPE